MKALPLQLANVDVHVRAGLYSGLSAIDDARIEGHGEVVFTNDVISAHRAELQNVTIQGATLQGGELTLNKVTFSGQRRLALELDGPLKANGVKFIATIEGVTGIAAKDAKIELTDARFQGGFSRAIDLSGGQLSLRDTKFEGAKTGVRALDTATMLQNVEALGGSASGFVFAGGTVTAKHLEVHGYEFGVQLSRDVEATMEEVTIRGSTESCLSSLQSKLSLTDAHFERCSTGLSLLNSTSTLSRIDVRDSTGFGVLLRQGTSTITKLEVHGVRKGDALHVRDAMVRLDESLFADVDGSGLFVSAVAKVTGGGVQVERASQSALFVERGSTLWLEHLLVRGGRGAAVVVPDAARVSLGTLSVSGGNEAPIYAECDQGARVEVGRIESTVEQLKSRCVIPRAGSTPGNGE
ncbi:MAG: hypothetical protein ACO1OB_04320 [Archangium sp.]